MRPSFFNKLFHIIKPIKISASISSIKSQKKRRTIAKKRQEREVKRVIKAGEEAITFLNKKGLYRLTPTELAIVEARLEEEVKNLKTIPRIIGNLRRAQNALKTVKELRELIKKKKEKKTN